uniref:Arginine--tRNA ligase, cytoplasmic n=1 Tax=Tanacetum cinerariifolium TaxID=118510 RepID=A0A699IH29_TANCI|nr:arginine--tRNA ligase, cytoplasmic [Tanacetum cinerariifolium]
MLGLCKTTEVVMNNCFLLLGIAPSSGEWTKEFTLFVHRKEAEEFTSFVHGKEARATDYHKIPLSEDARSSRKAVRLSGYITAPYGDEVIGNGGFLGQYKVVVYKAGPTKNIGLGKPHVLALHNSTLAVPAKGCFKMLKVVNDQFHIISLLKDIAHYYSQRDRFSQRHIYVVQRCVSVSCLFRESVP